MNKTLNSTEKSKPWYKTHGVSMSFLVLFYIVNTNPILISYLNLVPASEGLTQSRVEIIKVQEVDPHFAVKMPDGEVKTMEWPESLDFFVGKTKSPIWESFPIQSLVGCQATIQYAPIRWTLTERYRVWALSCPEDGFDVSLEKAIECSRSSFTVMLWVNGLGSIAALLFSLAVFVRERKGLI